MDPVLRATIIPFWESIFFPNEIPPGSQKVTERVLYLNTNISILFGSSKVPWDDFIRWASCGVAMCLSYNSREAEDPQGILSWFMLTSGGSPQTAHTGRMCPGYRQVYLMLSSVTCLLSWGQVIIFPPAVGWSFPKLLSHERLGAVFLLWAMTKDRVPCASLLHPQSPLPLNSPKAKHRYRHTDEDKAASQS